MQKQIFRNGDVVYHPEYGRGIVERTDESSVPVLVNFDDGEPAWATEKMLSFSEWPKPNHERPVENGWWVVAVKGYPEDPCVRLVKGGDVFTHPNRCTGDTSQYEFIRYLGKDWRTAE